MEEYIGMRHGRTGDMVYTKRLDRHSSRARSSVDINRLHFDGFIFLVE